MSPAPSLRTPPVIGLTGTIAAGKSTVAAILRDLGCIVSDSDLLARRAFETPAIRDQLRRRWGERVMQGTDDGEIDRAAIAEIVFEDANERRWLESIIHPWIERWRLAEFAAASPDVPALVIDAPLLLEAGLDAACSEVWMVDAPESERLARVRRDRGWSAEELRRREATQWPPDRKRAAADRLIVNAGAREELRALVVRHLAEVVH